MDLALWANASLSSSHLQAAVKRRRENDVHRWLMFYNNTLVLPFSQDTTTCRGCNVHVRPAVSRAACGGPL